jgi:hypothetical protein
MVMPSALALWRLMISNFRSLLTGRSAGFSPSRYSIRQFSSPGHHAYGASRGIAKPNEMSPVNFAN